MQAEVDAIIAAVSHPIPPLDSPYSPGTWQQPKREEIEVDDTHAMMSKRVFEALAEYNSSMPSGVYPGKMWKRHDGAFDPTCKIPVWLLCWYGYVPGQPKRCSINHRVILLVD